MGYINDLKKRILELEAAPSTVLMIELLKMNKENERLRDALVSIKARCLTALHSKPAKMRDLLHEISDIVSDAYHQKESE